MVPAGDGREPLRQGRHHRADQGLRGARVLPALVLQRDPARHRDGGPRRAVCRAADGALLRQAVLQRPVPEPVDAAALLVWREPGQGRAHVRPVPHHGATHRSADDRRGDGAGAASAAAQRGRGGLHPGRGRDVPILARGGGRRLPVVPGRHAREPRGRRLQAPALHHVAAAAPAAHRVRRGTVRRGRVAPGAEGGQGRERRARGPAGGAAGGAAAVPRLPGRARRARPHALRALVLPRVHRRRAGARLRRDLPAVPRRGRRVGAATGRRGGGDGGRARRCRSGRARRRPRRGLRLQAAHPGGRAARHAGERQRRQGACVLPV
mmetsp:Transcript_33626/g.84316  ORF Transcript_33626/g.84316 Transcript_33626/m.84316 type:complete len:323 (+) Transcript_33626:431-1399(+)